MKLRFLMLLIPLQLAVIAGAAGAAPSANSPLLRVAHIEIDPTQLEAYRAAATEQIDAAVRNEPGVLMLYMVAEKEDPTRVIVFEMYASPDAYRAHLETEHFKKYKATTQNMVKSLRLADVDPIFLGAKPGK